MRILFWTLNLILCLAVSGKSQKTSVEPAAREALRDEEILRKALSLLPKRGDRPEDFVPPQWKIINKAAGDLNADRRKDYAILMASDAGEMNEESETAGFRIIAVLFAGEGGKLNLQGVNYRLDGKEAGLYDDRYIFDLQIEKGVLIVNLNFGANSRTDVIYRFRQTPTGGGGRLKLIGFDVGHYCVSCNDLSGKWDTSENYLTGRRIETAYKKNTRPNSRTGLLSTDKKSKIPRVLVSFEKVRLNTDNFPHLRPF